MRRAIASSVLALLLLCAACGRDRTAPVETSSARQEAPAAGTADAPPAATVASTRGGAQAAPPAACPNAVAGTSMMMSETEDGVALTYTTTGDVADLRRRAAAMAEHMDARSGMGMGMGGRGMGMGGRGGMGPGMMGADAGPGGRGGMGPGMMGADAGPGGRGGGMQMRMMPSVDARVEDVSGGARVVLTPSDPAQLDELRAHMRQHEAMMRDRGCPWMQQTEEPAR